MSVFRVIGALVPERSTTESAGCVVVLTFVVFGAHVPFALHTPFKPQSAPVTQLPVQAPPTQV